MRQSAQFNLILTTDAGETIPFVEDMRFEVRQLADKTRFEFNVLWVMSSDPELTEPLATIPMYGWWAAGNMLTGYMHDVMERQGWRLRAHLPKRQLPPDTLTENRLITAYVLKAI